MTTISGRMEPRPKPCRQPRLRLFGKPDGQVRAVCECGFARLFGAGHTVEDFARFEAMGHAEGDGS